MADLSDDEYLAQFTEEIKPKPAKKAKKELSDDEYLAQFTKEPAIASSSPTAYPTGDLVSWKNPSDPERIRQQLAAANVQGEGLQRGFRDVGESIGNAGLWAANKLGLVSDAAASDVKGIRSNRLASYENQYKNNPLAEEGRFFGQTAATLPLMGAAGVGGNALGRSSPAIEFLAGRGGNNMLTSLLSKGAQGAIQGGEAAALTSASSPDDALGYVGSGAALGGILGFGAPALYQGAKAGLNKLHGYVEPFTASGRENIANRVIQHFGGEVPLNVGANANEIIPGSVPTMAEATGNPGIAKLQDTLRDINSQPFVERSAQNAAARNNALYNAMGTPQDIEAAASARSQAASALLGNPDAGIPGTLFSQAKPVDAAPVVNKIEEILQGKSGKRKSVVSSMNDVKGMLLDADDKPISDPETLYHSVRKGIGDLLDKKDLSNQAGKQASSQLIAVQDALDEAIEKGAPGFKKYLSDYSQASKPINAMEWMQGLKLTDSSGNITLSKIDNAIRNVEKLQSAPGINKAKALNDEQVSTLKSIREDLLRQQNLTLGKSYGSPTVQKSVGQNKLQAILPGNDGLFSGRMNPETLGAGAGTALGSMVGVPGAGAVLGGVAGKAISGAQGKRNQLIRNRLEQMVLNPESYSAPIASGGMDDSILRRLLSNSATIPITTLGINRLNQ